MSEQPGPSSSLKVVAFLLPVLLGAALYFAISRSDAPGGLQNAVQLAAVSQGLPLVAEQAIGGDRTAISQLRGQLSKLAQLRAGGVSPGPQTLWDRLRSDGEALVTASDSLVDVRPAAQSVVERMGEFRAGTAEILADKGAAPILEEFENAASELTTSIIAFADGEGDVSAQSASASAALDYLSQVLASLAGDEQARLDIAPLDDAAVSGQLAALKTVFAQITADADAALGAEDARLSALQSLRSLKRTAAGLLPALSEPPAATGPVWMRYLVPALLGLAILFSLALLVAYLRAAKAAALAASQTDQNERNQQAILRLLDELGSLADGDLTVQATVTEDITGAIADSINYAIEALRDLVATINDTAIMVDSAAKQTEAAAMNLSSSSKQQNVEVKATTDALGAIVSSIEEVSGNAERSSDVARHSVDVAHKGGEAVRRTIDGMNAIRETIQDTSKRIKRLGESSQEIGNIVELINDIAEQTNILALNASIQASMAGEAGRGFAVVADEVQRLAERCTNATKQIEVLVRTIQTDTNEAVVSMERSTTDVVGGALLAENAGAALDEIEQVSNQIASLVQNISGSSREQAQVAADIDIRAGNLNKISGKTEQDTKTTTMAIRKLSELASQLRNSVAGFHLPDIGANSGVYTTESTGLNKSDPGKVAAITDDDAEAVEEAS